MRNFETTTYSSHPLRKPASNLSSRGVLVDEFTRDKGLGVFRRDKGVVVGIPEGLLLLIDGALDGVIILSFLLNYERRSERNGSTDFKMLLLNFVGF